MECGDSSPLSVRDTRPSNDERKAAINRRTPYALATVGLLLLLPSCRAPSVSQEPTKEAAARHARHEAIRDEFWKALPNMPLEEMVAMADTISVLWFEENEDRAENYSLREERLKPNAQQVDGVVMELQFLPIILNFLSSSDEARAGTALVRFQGRLKEWDKGYVFKECAYVTTSGYKVLSGVDGKFTFYLSNTLDNNERIFPAPETIVEDVKAEIKRQAEE